MKLKIPPPIVAILCALLMWAVARFVSWGGIPVAIPWYVPYVFVALAILLDLLALMSFKAVKTTFNPLKPHTASALVTSGIYQYTRNPMYLGLFSILLAFVLWFGSLLNIAVLLLFVWYMNRFQIVHEEEALLKLFGEEYEGYRSRVRRWL